MTTYLIGYFAIGVLAIIILPLFNRDNDKDELSFLNKFQKPRFSLDWFLEELLVPIVGYSIVILAWPILIIMLVKQKLFPPKPYIPEQEIVFEVKPENLLTKLSINEIEEAEIVHDPLNAAPEIPFGHLNQAWLQFKEKIQDEDEIWDFQAMFKPEYGDEYERNGYVLVRENKPTSLFFECD